MVTHTGRSEEAAEEWGYQNEYIIWGQKSQQRVVFSEIPEDTALTKAMAHPLEEARQPAPLRMAVVALVCWPMLAGKEVLTELVGARR